MVTLEFQESNKIAILRFHNAEGSNCFDLKSAKALSKITKQLQKTRPHAIAWISDHQQFFCTGGDLGAQIKAKNLKGTLKDHLAIRKILAEFDALPCLKAVIINGDCYGGGIEILSCFQLTIATPKALLGFWQRKMGLSFGWGGGTRLLRRLSEQQVRWALTNQITLSPWEAQRLGLIDKVLDSPLALQHLIKWLEQQAKLGATTASLLPHWSPQNDRAIFQKLYGGVDHTQVLKQLSRPKKKV